MHVGSGSSNAGIMLRCCVPVVLTFGRLTNRPHFSASATVEVMDNENLEGHWAFIKGKNNTFDNP